MKTKNIFFIRHGETDWNREKRFQGGTDVLLNDLGREQAQMLRANMSELKIEHVISSDLSRAYETALFAVSDLRLTIHKDSRFREANIGQAEGCTLDEVVQKFGGDSVERWRSYDELDLDFKYPQGESKRQLMIRAREATLDVSQATDSQNIAIFSHGMFMRALTFAFKQGVNPEQAIFTNGSIHQFVWDERRPEHLRYLGKINQV